MNLPIEQDNCLVCRNSSLIPIPGYSELPRVTSDAKPFGKGGALHLCKKCATLQKAVDEKFLEESASIYHSYDLYASSSISSQVVFQETGEADRAALIAKKLSPYMKKDLLDIGAGNGAFLRAVSKENETINLNAYDINERKLNVFSSLENFSHFYSGQLEDVTEKFDVVSVQHVLEHIPDPLSFLSEIKKLIKPGGVLFIQVPDNDKNPFDILVADHVTHFYPETLSYLLELAGYEIVEFTREWVFKEISLIARPLDKPIVKSREHNIDAIYHKLLSNVDYLTNMISDANNYSLDQSFGIFGSSISSTWLYGSLKNKGSVCFFVDEDSTKKGSQHLGVPIYHPFQVPKDSVVYVPLVTQTVNNVIKRSKSENWSFKMHFRQLENISAIGGSQEVRS